MQTRSYHALLVDPGIIWITTSQDDEALRLARHLVVFRLQAHGLLQEDVHMLPGDIACGCLCKCSDSITTYVKQ